MKPQVGGLYLVDDNAWIYRLSDLRDFNDGEEVTTVAFGIVLAVDVRRPPWNTMCRMLLADGRLGWVRQTHLI